VDSFDIVFVIYHLLSVICPLKNRSSPISMSEYFTLLITSCFLIISENHIFEKKIHDMELAHTISIQMEAQIRMIRENDLTMIEKINDIFLLHI
jgi:hypothetical protein